MYRENKLASLNWCCQLLPCFDGELNLVCWWKMFIVSALALSNKETWNQVSFELETQPSRKLLCAGALSCWKLQSGVKVKLSPQMCESDCYRWFCGCRGETLTVCHQRTRWSSPSKQGSYSATDSTSWDERTCIHDTLWRQHYVTTSKELFN